VKTIVEKSQKDFKVQKLINIDNGGTLTDLCIIDGEKIYRTKTITTPHDLSQCIFDGLKKASALIYGEVDLQSLLLSTEAIRYSTTQGTNALVERKGPRIGLLLGGGLSAKSLQGDESAKDLFQAIVGNRYVELDNAIPSEGIASEAIKAVNALAAAGANRIVISFSGSNRIANEANIKRHLLHAFPPHLLGALPLLYASEIAEDSSDLRRTWTAVCNSFLHPAMEKFLYNAEHKLREEHTQSPLLIFRNDGNAGRVSRTIALKTYSSGPRGGMEGAKALARHYQFKKLLSMDIGGTTTDIGIIEDDVIRSTLRGRVENVETSFPLCDVVSSGVGGSSIIKVVDGQIKVGPESVGSTPGPACFGLGGKLATITDAFLLMGLLDPSSFFGGDLKLDIDRAKTAITEAIAVPLGVDLQSAIHEMEKAWVHKIAESITRYADVKEDMTLAAFGGGGPLVACKVAEAININEIIIPSLAAVFSAFGIGFSDIGHTFLQKLEDINQASINLARVKIKEIASRGMFSEGTTIENCKLEEWIEICTNDVIKSYALGSSGIPKKLTAGETAALYLKSTKAVPHPVLKGSFKEKSASALSTSTRKVLIDGSHQDLPLYLVEQQVGAVKAMGPAILEESFFTCRVDKGWSFFINNSGDILLTKVGEN
jgi:N-methylhydantoinase A/oxoprolinase/acetone carboxylase beta subunit